MKEKIIVKMFNNEDIRTIWREEEEKFYFSIVDVVKVLSESRDANNYWKVLKHRLIKEGNETVTKCNRLKMRATDGKMRLTDVCDIEQMLRLIQSIPSKNSEPFKLWLAEVGNDRIDETFDPELAIERALDTYRKKGYSDEWINQRLKTIDARNELTNEWKKRDIKNGKEFAILTNEIYKSWTDMSAKEYKNFKDLKKENLRDNMSNTELILNSLAEVATKEITQEKNPIGLKENKVTARKGGTIAFNARKELENEIGRSVVISQNNKKDNLIEN